MDLLGRLRVHLRIRHQRSSVRRGHTGRLQVMADIRKVRLRAMPLPVPHRGTRVDPLPVRRVIQVDPPAPRPGMRVDPLRVFRGPRRFSPARPPRRRRGFQEGPLPASRPPRILGPERVARRPQSLQRPTLLECAASW